MLLSQIQLEKTLNSSHERQDNSLTQQNLIPNTIVFIDAAVDDAQTLADGVIPGAEIIFLDPNHDGIEQITETLKQRTAVSSVHIVSHGSPGCLSLGSTQLCLDTFERYASDLQIWSSFFSRQSSQPTSSALLLYGCNVAAGEVGIAFVKQLHQATGANIAASGDRTGNSALGGTWELEYRVGKVEAPLAFQPWVMQAYHSVLPTALYNGTLGTLPQAQGFLAFADLLPNTAEQTLVAGGVTLNTTPQNIVGRRYAGYSNYSTVGTPANANFPVLDRTTGFSLSFNVAITQENSVSPDRAGFSFITISNDLQGIELGFNNNLIFAQQDNPLFTRGENIAFNTTQATNYTVRVLGNNYTLLANGTPILTGALRNYTASDPATSQPPLPIDPYELPNFLFFGDNTDQAQAITTISSIAVNRTPNNPANDTYTIDADTPLNVPINLGVLANDTDPEQDPLNSLLVAAPANGTLTLNPNGSFNYTANPGFIGTDSFTYQINDGDLTNPNAATVSITVTPTPVPTPTPTPVPTPTPTPLPINTALTLGLNPNNIFVIEGSSGQTQLKYSLVQGSSASVNEVGVVVVDHDTGTINGVAPGQAGYVQAALSQGTVIFSALSNPPNGFGVSNQTRNLSVEANDRLLFYIVQNSTTDTALADLAAGRTPPNIFFASSSFNTGGIDSLQVSNQGNGVFTLRWEDGVGGGSPNFNDLVMTVQLTTEPLKVGVTLQGESQHEVIDLRNQTAGLQAQFVVNREAAFDNFVGFYRVVDVNGGIDTDGNGTADVRPGEADYAQAAIQQRVQNLDLTVANQSTATFGAQLEGGFIYVPFLIANGRPDALLDGNSSNDPAVYFPFLGANADGVDHIRLLGDNTFGFEDLSGGGDRDYNDVIVRVNLA